MEIRKAPGSVGALTEAAGGMSGETNSISDCNTTAVDTQAIFDLLPRGEANAVSTKELVELTGCGSARVLQNRIAAEREDGRLILSTCKNGGGYFVPAQGPEGKAEIAAFISTLRSRALNTLKAFRAAKEALAEIEGQIDFDDLEGV